MKKLLTILFALLLLVPLCALADGLSAQVITYGEETTVLFTDEQGDMYLLFITEDGAQAISVSGSQQGASGVQQPPAAQDTACWHCGNSLAYGDHTSGNCGYKYHSACTDEHFKDPQGHELCAICGKCMYSSGSRHGIGFGLCGAAIMQEKETCTVCGGKMADHHLHREDAYYNDCWGHCWLSDEFHPACPICSEPLCNGEEHSAKGCAKKLQSNG